MAYRISQFVLKAIIAAVSVFVFASSASAQTNPQNPKNWAFDQDPIDGYAQTVNYDFGWFSSATAIAPIQFVTVNKPGTCSPCAIQTPLPSTPLAFQTWWAGVRATGAGGAKSGWSNLVPFDKVLAVPTNLRPQ